MKAGDERPHAQGQADILPRSPCPLYQVCPYRDAPKSQEAEERRLVAKEKQFYGATCEPSLPSPQGPMCHLVSGIRG